MTTFWPALFPQLLSKKILHQRYKGLIASSIPCATWFTSDAMDLCDLSSHHVVDKEVLSLSSQYHLLPVPAEVGRGDGKTLNVHTLKFRIHLTINLNKIKMRNSDTLGTE